MQYEMIREIFNRCSGNQMRDVFVSNVETDDPEAYVRSLLVGKEIKLEKSEAADGSVIIDVEINELRQRFSFSP